MFCDTPAAKVWALAPVGSIAFTEKVAEASSGNPNTIRLPRGLAVVEVVEVVEVVPVVAVVEVVALVEVVAVVTVVTVVESVEPPPPPPPQPIRAAANTTPAINQLFILVSL
jgi:hypothetical protein